ncbi:VUT family protein [Streptomyces sp. NPDC000941]
MRTLNRAAIGLVAMGCYAGAVFAANWTTNRYGVVSVAPGFTATAGTVAAGAALLFRDAVQDRLGRRAAVTAVVLGAGLSAVTAPTLALASAVAFLLAELADFAVYAPLRRRGWMRAVVASNVVGALLDTALFLTLAGYPVTAGTVAGQLVGKGWATAVPVAVVLVLRRVPRAVPDHAVGT